MTADDAMEERPYQPPFIWRNTSTFTLGVVGFLSRSFLFAFNNTEVHGLDNFLKIVDGRADDEGRERGLISGTYNAT